MLYEFALEPSVLSSWQSFRYFSEKFGVEHGRLISKFPKRWKKLVYEACEACRDLERKRIEERLRQEQFDRKLLRPQRMYDGRETWLRNAEDQQLVVPFHAIIAEENPNEHEAVRVADQLDETDSLWAVQREGRVARTPTELAGCAARLLQVSKEILLVDPYFDPQISRWQNVLTALIDEATAGNRIPHRLELHCSNRRSGTMEHWERQCQAQLPERIPRGVILRLVRWEERQPGERFHARYILTELGGIRYDSGLDAGEKGDSTDVSLLDSALHSRRWNDFQEEDAAGNPQPTTFAKVDEVLVAGVRPSGTLQA